MQDFVKEISSADNNLQKDKFSRTPLFDVKYEN